MTKSRVFEFAGLVLGPISVITLFLAVGDAGCIGCRPVWPSHSQPATPLEAWAIGASASVFVASIAAGATIVRRGRGFFAVACSAFLSALLALYFCSFFLWRTAAYQTPLELHWATVGLYSTFPTFFVAGAVGVFAMFKGLRKRFHRQNAV